MDKNVAAIEFGSKKLKLVVGYEHDGKVYVIYTLTKPYSHIIEAGKVVDEQLLRQAINEIKRFCSSVLSYTVTYISSTLLLTALSKIIFKNLSPNRTPLLTTLKVPTFKRFFGKKTGVMSL